DRTAPARRHGAAERAGARDAACAAYEPGCHRPRSCGGARRAARGSREHRARRPAAVRIRTQAGCAAQRERARQRSLMRVLPVAIGLLLVAAPAAAQRKVAERLPAAPDGYVRVHNIAGSVKLIGWDRDSVAVTGTVHD